MSRRSCFFEGFIFGTLIGGIIGLLFAPRSGIETREYLRNIQSENGDVVQDTKEKTESLIEKTKDAIEQGFDRLSSLIDQNKEQNKERSS